jgi:hypothetical protein
MIITNNYGLPGPLVDAIKNDSYNSKADASVTELLKPLQAIVLGRIHKEEIVEDASDRIWSLLGQSVHSVLERHETSDRLQEERLFTKIHGWTISGQADLLEGDVLTDYKVTSVWSIIYGHEDWEIQLNLLRYLFHVNGFTDIKKLQICAIIRDWQRSKALADKEYPQQPATLVQIPLWDIEKAEAWIKNRVMELQNAYMDPDNLPECGPEERWAKPDTYAVIKEGNKRAHRVFNTPEEADALKAELGAKYIVEKRLGNQSVRCEYCSAAAFCKQYKTLKGE